MPQLVSGLPPRRRDRFRSSWFSASRGPSRVLVAGALLIGVLPTAGARAATAANATDGSSPAYWVFFRDRGEIRADDASLARAAEAVTAESWRVRAASPLGVVPDERDLPLWEPYVKQVAEQGRVRHRSRWLNAVSVELESKALPGIRALPFVREVRPVARARRESLGPVAAPDGTPLGVTLPGRAEGERGPYPYGTSYGQLLEINVPSVHAEGYTGNRVRMMMLDTGFRKSHAAFGQARILAERDFVFGDGDVQNEPEDDPDQHNHGTGCWAVAGGYDPGRLVGPAYGAAFVLSKTEDVRSETQAEEDYYVAALEWADSLGVRVTSASLSYTCFDDGFCYDFPLKDGDTPVISRAVDIAAARGILCVNSAGNYGFLGPRSLGTPADADSMLAVGAVDSLNVIAGFSSRGPSDDGRTKPEVVARGLYTWWANASDPQAYGYASGTSLSCPLVGGASALLAEAHPEWTNMDIRAALLSTADRQAAPNNDYGWGRIDVGAALHAAPVVFPLPFDLVSPAGGALWPNLQPVFTWRRTTDPDAVGGPITYRVLLRDTSPAGPSWELLAGSDTTLALGFALAPGRSYEWEVSASDSEGNRRFSREARVFFTPGGADAPGAVPIASRLLLQTGPNPFAGEVRIAWENATGPVRWAVYDPIGRRVAASGSDEVESGTGIGAMRRTADGATGTAGSAVWDGRGRDSRPIPAGVYYVEATAGAQSARRVLVKLR